MSDSIGEKLKQVRNAKGDALKADTIMYAASLTKTAFAYYVLMLADEGKLEVLR